MRFETKSKFGLLGEHLWLDVLRFQTHLEVKLNTGPGFIQGYGIRYHSATANEVVPDLDILRYGQYGPRGCRRENGEVKTKKLFCAWNTDDPESAWSWDSLEIRTGIDVSDWRNYVWYAQKHFDEPLWMMFVHPLPYVQLRDRKYTKVNIEPGIYLAELSQIFHKAKPGAGPAGQMVFWDISDLTLFRTAKSLKVERSTRDLWEKLVTLAGKHLADEKLVKVADLNL